MIKLRRSQLYRNQKIFNSINNNNYQSYFILKKRKITFITKYKTTLFSNKTNYSQFAIVSFFFFLKSKDCKSFCFKLTVTPIC